MPDLGDDIALETMQDLKSVLDSLEMETNGLAKEAFGSYIRDKLEKGLGNADAAEVAATEEEGKANIPNQGLGADAEPRTQDPPPAEIVLPTSCIETQDRLNGRTESVARLPKGFELCGKDYAGYTLPIENCHAEQGNWTRGSLSGATVTRLTSPGGEQAFVPTASLTAKSRAFEAFCVFSQSMAAEHGELLRDAACAEETIAQALDAADLETPDELRNQVAELTVMTQSMQRTIDELKAEVSQLAADHPVSLARGMRKASDMVSSLAAAIAGKWGEIMAALESLSAHIAKTVTRDLPALAACKGAAALDAAAKPFARASEGLSGKAESLKGNARGLQSSKADEMLALASAEQADARRAVETSRISTTSAQTRTRGAV